MKVSRTTLVAIIMIAITLLGSALPAHAQCSGLVVRNDSSISLDEAAICAAAQPLVGKGFQVYVWATDADPQTEDDWFAMRDQVEGPEGWGIYNPADNTFAKGAVSVEFTTVTSHPWGHDLAFGEYLFGTPLNNDGVIGQIEGGIKNTVAQGDVNGAVVNALTTAYAVGFPPPPPTPVSQPTVIIEGPTTNVNVDARPVLAFFGWVLALGVLAVGGFFVVTRVVVPVVTTASRLQKLRQHAEELRAQLNKLLNTSSKVLQGENPESTLVYTLWKARGGTQYEKRDADLREQLRRAQVALSKIFVVWRALPKEAPHEEQALRKYVSQLETLVLTLIGRQQRILNLTEAELLSLLDPSLSVPRQEEDTAAVVAQVEQLARDHEGAGKLRINFMVVRPESVDAEGILGYLDLAKSALHELTVARDEGPKALEAAEGEFLRLKGELKNPALPASTLLQFPDGQIKYARLAQRAQQWLEVKEFATQAQQALAKIPGALKAYADAYSQYDKFRQEANALLAEGYRSNEASAALKESEEDAGEVKIAFEKGDYGRAEEYSRELVADVTRALKALLSLQDLRAKNENGLKQLSTQVAKADSLRTLTVQAAWKQLQEYPQSNWSAVAGNFDAVTKELSALMDNPDDAEDVASRIADANSMRVQHFADAEKMLAEAMSKVRQAEEKLKAITSRLTEVQQLQTTVVATIVSAEAEIAKAQSRRDADNTKIDRAVDREISEAEGKVVQAKQLNQAREFTLANESASAARQLAVHAYSSADSQAKVIDGLYVKLAKLKESAAEKVRQALVAQSNLTPVAQQASTAGLANRSQDTLRAAQQAERQIGGEDQALKESLRAAVDKYEEAGVLAVQALDRIAQDKREYEGHVSSAQSAISSAESAISTASRYVRDSDAGGAGRSALSRAQEMVPAAPSYGEAQEALERRKRAAQAAEEQAERAAEEAQRRIRQAEDEREAQRRRQQAEEAARRAQEVEARRERERTEERKRSSSSGSSGSVWSSSSGSDSHRGSSSSGSSTQSRPSSMGSSNRR